MTGRQKNIAVLLIVVHAAILIVYASLRMVGGDEGVYFAAAQNVGLGKALYSDFFYTQMPLLPTIFSPLATYGWTSFWILRGFTVLAGILSAILFYLIVSKISKNGEVALISLGLYVFSGLIISMHTIFESPIFAHCLSLAVFLIWYKYWESKEIKYLILAGFSLSALINLRATFALLFPLYVWSVIALTPGKRFRSIVIFALSMIPPAIPTFLAMSKSPTHFFFDNYTFQIYRETDRSLAYFMSNKLTTIYRTILDPHLLIIIILTCVAVYYLIKFKGLGSFRDIVTKPEGMALANLALIAFSYIFPHPTLRHYFEQYIAFALIMVAFGMENIRSAFHRLVIPVRRKLVLILISVAYLVSIIPYVAIDVFAVRDREKWRPLSEVRKITEKMLVLAGPSDTVLTEWPLYPFLTRQPALPYSEIITAQWAMPLDHTGFMKYKLCDSVYLRESIAARSPALVVTVFKAPDYYSRELNAGYRKAFQSDAMSVYERQ